MTRRGGEGDDDALPPGRRRPAPTSVAAGEDFCVEVLRAGRSQAHGGTPIRPQSARPDREVTSATGPLAGTPSGRRTRIDPNIKDDVRRSLERENEAATILAAQGYQTHQNPTRAETARARQDTGDSGRPDSDPDYLVEGRVFDCYAPTAGKPVRGVWWEAKAKVERQQTQRVVLNLADWRGDMAALEKQFDDWPINNMREVKAIRPDGTIVQIFPKRGAEHGA